MKCTMCDRELRKEVSEDGYQVDYICPVHGVVRGTISNITYREANRLKILKHVLTGVCCIGAAYNLLLNRWVVAYSFLFYAMLHQTGQLYEILSNIDHFINRSVDQKRDGSEE